MTKVKTVISAGVSIASNGKVNFEISDHHSGDRIINIEFTPEELGLLLTGLHGVKGIADVHTGENIAKKRETMKVTCDKVSNKITLQAIVRDHSEEEYAPLGYLLHDDGTGTQQPTQLHQYIIKRYVPVEDVLDVERYY
ncbi:hypothetical protein KASIA_p018 [Shewanella phage vB_SspS_KASIA]|nr:hypothetical protein KASIA_p018 [Shewanella phage vB_SspS_KASIA]